MQPWNKDGLRDLWASQVSLPKSFLISAPIVGASTKWNLHFKNVLMVNNYHEQIFRHASACSVQIACVWVQRNVQKIIECISDYTVWLWCLSWCWQLDDITNILPPALIGVMLTLYPLECVLGTSPYLLLIHDFPLPFTMPCLLLLPLGIEPPPYFKNKSSFATCPVLRIFGHLQCQGKGLRLGFQQCASELHICHCCCQFQVSSLHLYFISCLLFRPCHVVGCIICNSLWLFFCLHVSVVLCEPLHVQDLVVCNHYCFVFVTQQVCKLNFWASFLRFDLPPFMCVSWHSIRKSSGISLSAPHADFDFESVEVGIERYMS